MNPNYMMNIGKISNGSETIMIIKEFDTVLLKDGIIAYIMEAFDNKVFIADVGSSPKDWETIDITIDDIEKVIYTSED